MISEKQDHVIQVGETKSLIVGESNDGRNTNIQETIQPMPKNVEGTDHVQQKPSEASTEIEEMNSSKCEFGDLTLLLLDLETTGLSTRTDRIIQFAAGLWDLNQVEPLCTFKSLVNPGDTKISESALRATGRRITQETVENAADFGVVAKRFLEWLQCKSTHRCKKLIVVAHNGINFDFRLLRTEFTRFGVSWDQFLLPDLCFFDSLVHFRSLRKAGLIQIQSLALGNLYQKIVGQTCERMHDALVDILALGRIVLNPCSFINWHEQMFLSWSDLEHGVKQASFRHAPVPFVDLVTSRELEADKTDTKADSRPLLVRRCLRTTSEKTSETGNENQGVASSVLLNTNLIVQTTETRPDKNLLEVQNPSQKRKRTSFMFPKAKNGISITRKNLSLRTQSIPS